MKVPHTGSFLRASAVGSGCGLGLGLPDAVGADGWNSSEKAFMMVPITARSSVITTTATTASRITRIYFFFGAGCFFEPGFSKLVSTEEPIDASMALAASALGPVGCSDRYFWNWSAVPAGGTIFPSG